MLIDFFQGSMHFYLILLKQNKVIEDINYLSKIGMYHQMQMQVNGFVVGLVEI